MISALHAPGIGVVVKPAEAVLLYRLRPGLGIAVQSRFGREELFTWNHAACAVVEVFHLNSGKGTAIEPVWVVLLGDEDGVGRRRWDVFEGVCESEFVVDGFIVVVKSLRLRFWDVEQGIVKGEWGSLEEGLSDIGSERYRISHGLCEDATKVDNMLVIFQQRKNECLCFYLTLLESKR
jgi:hypothetical protein